jgi:hypothetical protein
MPLRLGVLPFQLVLRKQRNEVLETAEQRFVHNFVIDRRVASRVRLKVGEWVSLNLRISRSVDLWQDSTCPKRSANRKNSRIRKSAISRKQPMLFSGKQWETSSLGRTPRRSVNLAQVGVDNHATDLTKRRRQRRRGSHARGTALLRAARMPGARSQNIRQCPRIFFKVFLRGKEGDERATGIEPAWPAWKAGTLPLSYARVRTNIASCANDSQRPRLAVVSSMGALGRYESPTCRGTTRPTG